MTPQKRNKIIFLTAMINCLQFLLLTTIAMFFYPGGTFSDPNTIGYSIWNNLFSDLGRYIAHSGESNLISFFMYNISLFLMGALYIPYFLVYFSASATSSISKPITSAFGLIPNIFSANSSVVTGFPVNNSEPTPTSISFMAPSLSRR